MRATPDRGRSADETGKSVKERAQIGLLVAAGLLGMMLLSSGCSAASHIDGTWTYYGKRVYTFHTDGTYACFEGAYAQSFGSETGTYAFKKGDGGSLLVLHGVHGCGASVQDQELAYKFIDPNHVQLGGRTLARW